MKRGKRESYKAYRKRRAASQAAIRRYLRGRLVWNSSMWGTYRREKD